MTADPGARPTVPRDGDVGPDNVVVVLLDSLNRHHLGCYGGDEFDTPNLDRFARERATRFDRHVTGSLPCMPARHDILCGALDFLWKPWGSIELWEAPVTRALGAAGVTTMLVTDHPHLFETGGENYHTDFFGWEYLRGHEGDAWRTCPDPTWMGAPARPAVRGGWWWERQGLGQASAVTRGYDRSRTWFRAEEDYPGPKTMDAAADWLRRESSHHDRWLLFVDEFDPHEPFDTPDPWWGRYDDEPWQDEALIWPPYAVGAVAGGDLSEREAGHIRANYGSKLAMIDHWFGRVLDALDEQGLWDTTAVVVCTDHGHYLGEERGGADIWGKPAVPQYEPLGHTPLLVHWPGRPGGGVVDALTTNVDLHATLCDVFGVSADHRTHGVSLVPLLRGDDDTVREWAIGGVYGNWVQVTDGHHKYARAPEGDGFPLAMWSNRWSTMPVHGLGFPLLPLPDGRATLDYMPGSTVPVLRQPFRAGDMIPLFASSARIAGDHHLYDLDLDPDEQENRQGEAGEKAWVDALEQALRSVEAPAEQFARLGLG
jgi:arylsulfatase A-like enzyme